ncbi:MAG: hypothetical protein JKY51_10730, partial [Opitutaceae bacterium]|nr:hypothetical protein [Opitutaceae bacterium]
MKNALLFVTALLASILSLSGESEKAEFDFVEFGKTPILLNGRIKPIDTVARTSLRLIHDKQTLRIEEGKLTAIHWLTELLMSPQTANERKIFSIRDPEVVDLLKLEATKKHNFSYSQILPSFEEIDRQTNLAGAIEGKDRSYFQKNIITLREKIILYQRLKNSLQPEDSPNFQREVEMFALSIDPGLEAIEKRETTEGYDHTAFNQLVAFGNRYQTLEQTAYFFILPPSDFDPKQTKWLNIGEALLRTIAHKKIHPVVQNYANIIGAYQNEAPESFNQEVSKLLNWYKEVIPSKTRKSQQETFFNSFQPFYWSIVLYVVVFLLACASWLTAPKTLGKTAFYLCILAFIIHTVGLGFRM